MAEMNLDEIFKKIANSPDIVDKIMAATKNSENDEGSNQLSKIIDAISPVINQSKDEAESEKTDTPPRENQEQLLSQPLSRLGEKINKNSKLLLALKPYLSSERSEIIDTIVKIAQVGDLMKLLK